MKPTALIANLAVAVAFGVLVVGHGVALVVIESRAQLVDANLAKAMALPLLLRLDEVMLVALVILSLTAGRACGMRVATTLALLALMAILVDRLWLLPQLGDAWARVDLVAQRPLARLEQARTYHDAHRGVAAGVGLLLLGLVVLLTWRPRRVLAAAVVDDTVRPT